MRRWFEKSVVYQIYPLSFKDSNGDGIGDIQGIISKLPYISDLGVDIIWLSPIYQSPMEDNGYDISDYYSINPMFGTLDDFKLLLEKAHQLNLKIIMDLVINHTSDEHVWFKEALKGKDNPYRNYYIWREPLNGKEPSDLESAFTGSAWELDEQSEQYYFHLFSKKQPDLNWDNPLLRNELYNMINWWLGLGIDGFRLDVIDLIGKDIDRKITYNGPKLYERLSEMYEHCFKDRRILTVGETPATNLERAIQYTNSKNPVLDMIFNFEHCTLDEVKDLDKWNLKDINLIDLKQVFKKWQKGLSQVGWNSLFWSNHDTPRIISRYHKGKENSDKRGKMLATLLHFMQGTPYIYQGDEIGMTNIHFDKISDYKDIETLNIYKEKRAIGWSHEKTLEAIHKKSRDNARTPMQWNDSQNAGFTEGTPWIKVNPNYRKINVKNNLNKKNSLYHYYKKLIKLRKELDVITDGEFDLVYEHNDHLFSYKRFTDSENLVVFCNFYQEPCTIELKDDQYKVLICNYDDFVLKKEIILRPYEAFALYKTN